jgi:hypothetical protein
MRGARQQLRPPPAGAAERHAPKDILYGTNIVSLAGLLLTAFGLTLRRMGRAGLPPCLGVMSVGTALVLAGLYVGGGSH